MSDGPLRFCPFCKEAFEDVERCPMHELQLVSLRELGARAAAADDEAEVPGWSLGRGRGAVLSGALLTLVAFLCPLASLTGEQSRTSTLYALARGRALHLWVVPCAALAVLLVLYRRRTGPTMRGARLALLFVSLLPSAVVAYTLRRAQEAADLLAYQPHSDVQLHIGLGAWLVWLACVPLLWGSAAFGARRRQAVR